MVWGNKRLNNIESILKTQHKSYMKVIERIYGMEVRLLRQLERKMPRGDQLPELTAMGHCRPNSPPESPPL